MKRPRSPDVEARFEAFLHEADEVARRNGLRRSDVLDYFDEAEERELLDDIEIATELEAEREDD